MSKKTGIEKVQTALKSGKKVTKNTFKEIINIRATISILRSRGMKIKSSIKNDLTIYSL